MTMGALCSISVSVAGVICGRHRNACNARGIAEQRGGVGKPPAPLAVQRARTFGASIEHELGLAAIRGRAKQGERDSNVVETRPRRGEPSRLMAPRPTAMTCKPAASSRGCNLANCSSRACGACVANKRTRTGPLFKVLAQGILRAVLLEGEIREWRRCRRADLRARVLREDAGRPRQQEVDQVPPLVGSQLVGKARHDPIVAAIADPPENLTGLVSEQMRLGQVRRADRELGGKRPVAATRGAVARRAILRVQRRSAGDRWRRIRLRRSIKARRVGAARSQDAAQSSRRRRKG